MVVETRSGRIGGTNGVGATRSSQQVMSPRNSTSEDEQECKEQELESSAMARMVAQMTEQIAAMSHRIQEMDARERARQEADRQAQVFKKVEVEHFSHDDGGRMTLESLGVPAQGNIQDRHQPLSRLPSAKEMKLVLRPFDGRETYKGLGSGFFEWGRRFMRQVALAEATSQKIWPEDIR
jgi:TolA-binding protein